jgi:hypothetical protein
MIAEKIYDFNTQKYIDKLKKQLEYIDDFLYRNKNENAPNSEGEEHEITPTFKTWTEMNYLKIICAEIILFKKEIKEIMRANNLPDSDDVLEDIIVGLDYKNILTENVSTASFGEPNCEYAKRTLQRIELKEGQFNELIKSSSKYIERWKEFYELPEEAWNKDNCVQEA